MSTQIINPWSWQDHFGFAQANEISHVDRVLICSGQMAVDENGAVLHEGDMCAQVGTSMDNLETVLKHAGHTLGDVVKLTIFTTNVDQYLQAIDLVTTRIAEAGCTPAMTLIGVSRLAFPELLVEIEAIAVK